MSDPALKDFANRETLDTLDSEQLRQLIRNSRDILRARGLIPDSFMDVEEFKEYDWNARREVVIVGDTQVETFEDFLRATEQSQDKTSEVWFFPPMVGG